MFQTANDEIRDQIELMTTLAEHDLDYSAEIIDFLRHEVINLAEYLIPAWLNKPHFEQDFFKRIKTLDSDFYRKTIEKVFVELCNDKNFSKIEEIYTYLVAKKKHDCYEILVFGLKTVSNHIKQQSADDEWSNFKGRMICHIETARFPKKWQDEIKELTQFLAAAE